MNGQQIERTLVATFEHEDDLIAATISARGQGLQIVDAYTPYAVHGLDEAMGLKSSRLTWVCFICGIAGALSMLAFEHWTAAVSWAIDVGGKPWNSLPSDVPVAFEAAVLLAGFGSVGALLAVSRLYPGKKGPVVSPRVTDDQFVLVIDETDARFDLQRTESLLYEAGAVHVEEHLARHGEITSC